MKSFIGIKKGMTKSYDGDNMVPVTVVEVPRNMVFSSKKGEKGSLVRIGILKKKKTNKPESGTYKEVGYAPKYSWDLWIDEDVKAGTEYGVETLKVGDVLQITGVSKSKGFAGVVKRHGFSGGSKTHGQSDKERHAGTIGAGTDPGRVMPGRKMAGRMGGEVCTVIKRKVIDVGDDYFIVKGPLPGSNGTYLKVKVTKNNGN